MDEIPNVGVCREQPAHLYGQQVKTVQGGTHESKTSNQSFVCAYTVQRHPPLALPSFNYATDKREPSNGCPFSNVMNRTVYQQRCFTRLLSFSFLASQAAFNCPRAPGWMHSTSLHHETEPLLFPCTCPMNT